MKEIRQRENTEKKILDELTNLAHDIDESQKF
jgi:hypothetical protein